MCGTTWSGRSPRSPVLKRAVDRRRGRMRGETGAAVAGMTHAWLITGPPGSGRSNAGRAFAAALQCHDQGCGECNDCRTALSGAHPDVSLIRTELLSIRVSEIRELVRRAAMSPTQGRWQVMVVEDADRLTEQAADALLKSIEEPSPRTVWVLCAPTVEDVVPTIRSRCRLLVLRTPPVGGGRGDADQQARCGSGAGRVRGAGGAGAHRPGAGAGARRGGARPADQGARGSVRVAGSRGLPEGCPAAGRGGQGRRPRPAPRRSTRRSGPRSSRRSASGPRAPSRARPNAALKELEDQQKARAKRWERDVLDRSLVDLMALYRDVLVRADQRRLRVDQRRTAPEHRATRPAGRRRSRRFAGSTRSPPAAKPSRPTSRRCSPSRR